MDKIFYGGPIITMDDNRPKVEAVYVKDNKIQNLGNYDEIIKYKTESTELIDLSGKTMMPGFFEPHAHPELASIQNQAYYNGGIKYEKSQDVINVIRKAVEETPKGKWIMCFGLDYLINRDLPHIDRYFLDEISTDHPIILLIQSMHTIFVNSKALETMKITSDTQSSRDGHIYKFENGEPMGILTEQGLNLPFVIAWLNDLGMTPNELLSSQYNEFKKVGITTVWTAGTMPLFPDHFKTIRDFTLSEKSPIRNDYAITFNSVENGSIELDNILSDNEKSKFTGIKFWYDGSPYTGNMFIEENYLENEIMQDKLLIPPNQSGERLFSKEIFCNLLEKYHNLGYQISVHTQGDRSSREVLEMFEKILAKYPREDHRHRLEHCAFMHKEDIEKCGKLGITLSYHTGHIYYYGEALREVVMGPERTEKMMSCKTAIENGIKISFHSDDPMYRADPLRVACNAITRTSKKGTVIGEAEAISVHEAMKGITINCAWQLFREKELGSIEVGKFADFTILEENPYTVDPLRIGDIKVVTTYINGINTDSL